MHRLATPILALLPTFLLAACDGDKPKPARPPAQEEKVQPPPVAPATGLSNIQKRQDELAKEIEALEEQESPDPRVVRGVLKGIDNLIVALDLSIAAEARQSLDSAYTRARAEQAARLDRNNVMRAELRNIEAMLSGAESIPEGFTKTELGDKRKDLTAKLDELKTQQEAAQVKLVEMEKQLNTDSAPAPEDSLAVREREALRKLRERAAALSER